MDQDRKVLTSDLSEKPNEIRPEIIFKDDVFFIFFYRKFEKVLQALYLITNYFKDEEPIKWEIRKGGDAMLSFIIQFYLSHNESDKQALRLRMLEVITFLEIAQKSNLISIMNFEIIKGEMYFLHQTFESRQNKHGVLFSREFFDVAMDAPLENSYIKKDGTESIEEEKYKGHDKGHKMSFISNLKNTQKSVEKIKDRREIILSIIAKNKSGGIKDISAVIKDCSEKTLQRELISLVKDGKLKKVGGEKVEPI